MKFITVIAALLFSSFSFAVEYSKDSILPSELKTKVTAALNKQCGHVLHIKELSTTEKQDFIDNGVVYYYFTSLFTGTVGIDQYATDTVQLEVKSVIYPISNPLAGDPLVVESVRCNTLF